MGWLPNRLPTACGLALERGASLSVLAVAWLERGASASRSGIRHARHVPQLFPRTGSMLMAAVMIGVDPHKGSLRHEAHCCIARAAGRDERRYLWI